MSPQQLQGMRRRRRDVRPLRVQVRDWVMEILVRGNYATGDRIPTEEELVDLLDVSRGTLREGLQLLEQEGVIRSRHGSGRYMVASPKAIALDITRLRSVHEFLREHSIAHRVVVLEACERGADEATARALELPVGGKVISVERVHRAEGVPIIYSIDVFPKSVATTEWQPADFEGSLLALLESRWGVAISHSSSTLRAVTLDRKLAARVGVKPSVPWILFDQVNFDAQGHPVVYSQDYHRGEHIGFQVMRFRR
jgi:GntR family transcriptional regulator